MINPYIGVAPSTFLVVYDYMIFLYRWDGEIGGHLWWNSKMKSGRYELFALRRFFAIAWLECDIMCLFCSNWTCFDDWFVMYVIQISATSSQHKTTTQRQTGSQRRRPPILTCFNTQQHAIGAGTGGTGLDAGERLPVHHGFLIWCLFIVSKVRFFSIQVNMEERVTVAILDSFVSTLDLLDFSQGL